MWSGTGGRGCADTERDFSAPPWLRAWGSHPAAGEDGGGALP